MEEEHRKRKKDEKVKRRQKYSVRPLGIKK